MEHEALVIILSAGGSPLTGDTLDALPDVRATWVRVEREGSAACLAARVRHPDAPDRFRDRIRQWAGARGWTVTVARHAPDR